MSDFVSPNTEYMQLFLFVLRRVFLWDFLHAYRRIQRLHYSKILSSILILVYQIHYNPSEKVSKFMRPL